MKFVTSLLLAGLLLGISFLIIFTIGFHYIIDDISKELTFEMPSQGMANIAIAETMNGFEMMGLYAVTFLSIAMAALLGADTLAGEINSGTIQTIATKPIRSSDVVLGKWLGFAGLLGLYVLLMAGGVVVGLATIVRRRTRGLAGPDDSAPLSLFGSTPHDSGPKAPLEAHHPPARAGVVLVAR